MSLFRDFLRRRDYSTYHRLTEVAPVPQHMQQPTQQKFYWDRLANNMKTLWSMAANDTTIAAAQQQWQALEPLFRKKIAEMGYPTNTSIPVLRKVVAEVLNKARGSLTSTAAMAPTTPAAQPATQGQPAAPQQTA